ncbi:MAG: MtrB/PioB family outer membrane beta-barrel protein [Acidobacteriota bacterium]
MRSNIITLRRSLPVLLAAALALAMPMRAEDAKPAEESTIGFEAVLGGQTVNDVDARGAARFEEFREVPEGAVFEFGRVAWDPKETNLHLSLTAIDAAQKDQRYYLSLAKPGMFSFKASYVENPRFYSSGSKTLWSGVGTGRLTIDETFRQGAETAAGAPTAPFASSALKAYMDAALAGVNPFDLKTQRKDLKGALGFTITPELSLSLTALNEKKDGTKPLGFGTYIRRQALAGTPGTGAGNFWRESVEARGNELVEPLRYKTAEFGATLTWAKNGHSASAGWFGSRFRNDIQALYFDNPFEASPGRSTSTIFDPKSEQETGAPNGNNNFRGLYARSSTALWPDNDYNRFFGNVSLRLGDRTRLNASVARGTMKQDDAFLPYAESDQVVYSGVAGQAGVVYAKDAPLPQASLNGKMTTTEADVKLTSRVLEALGLRAGYRYYGLDDQRPEILFPGFSSSGDSYFRPGIGQRDAAGNRILFNEIGGYTRQRLNFGAAWRTGVVTLDGDYAHTRYRYDARQVDGTDEDAFKGTVRVALPEGNLNVFYLHSRRDFDGDYRVGLETSGVRAFDVWKRTQDQVGADLDLSFGEHVVAGIGGKYSKEKYPGAVTGFAYGYGLQDSNSRSVYASVNYTKDDFVLGGWVGFDRYGWNSLQVTKTSLGADYNPTNRWTRESKDDVFWIGFEAVVPITKTMRLRADVNYQKFVGEWNTTNVATPDNASAVAYAFPELSDSTLTVRGSFLWNVTKEIGFELRYVFEPYRLNDFTQDNMQPYMQGSLKETRSSAADIGDMNVSRFLFLDSRYTSYTAHVVSALVHLKF